MKFKAGCSSLQQAVSKVIGAIGGKSDNPILGNLLLNVKDGVLTVKAANRQMEMSSTSGVDPDEDGSITVPAKKFFDILKADPQDSQISFSLDEKGDSALLRFSRSRFKLATLPSDLFPSSESVTPDADVKIDQSQLKSMLDSVSFSMAAQDVRYYLNGMLVDVNQGVMRLVTTDGHRLSAVKTEVECSSEEHLQIILPRDAISQIGKMLDKSNDDITLSFNRNHLKLKCNDVELTAKLIDGRFPDYTRVIPANNENIMKVGVEDFLSKLRQVSVVSDEKFKRVTLSLKNNSVALSMVTHSDEVAENEAECSYSSNDLEVGFNVLYLIEVFSHLKGDVAEVAFGGENTAIKIAPENWDNIAYVVMPMR